MTTASVSFGPERDGRRLDAAIPAIAFLVGENRLEQIVAPEVGPERFSDPDLGIRDLPQQEIADAHFAAGPNEEIGIRLTGGIQKVAEGALVERFRRDACR